MMIKIFDRWIGEGVLRSITEIKGVSVPGVYDLPDEFIGSDIISPGLIIRIMNRAPDEVANEINRQLK